MPIQFSQKPDRFLCAVSRFHPRWLLLLLAFLPRFVLAGNFYAGTSPSNVPWPGGVVPYEFTNTLTAAETNTYMNGLREWQLAANVQFVPHNTQAHWILFAYNTNGFDNVSATTNPQVVSVSSLSRAQVCHEMGHSFGFTHENIRPDAPNYILVLTNNIANELVNISWFSPDPTSVTNGPYDYESVMHLGWDFESVSPGVTPTQQPKPPNFPRYQYRMGNFCLSPGDRAALAYLYAPPAVPLTNVVTTTADAGPGSLRAAMYYATDHPGTTVRFNIPVSDPGYSNGVFNLHLTGMLPPLAANGMVIDGSTQSGFAGKPLIFVDASQIIPQTFTSDTFLIYSASNRIKNISFSGFDWNGMTLEYLDATNNTVSGCWFGLDATGTNAAPNANQGILIAAGASRNIIGGSNVLSGNSQYGIFLTNTTGNVVTGNLIGLDATGTKGIGNGSGYGGVLLTTGATNNTIGGTLAGARNVISGNDPAGIFLAGTTSGNLIEGNYIGTDLTGTNAVPNTLAGVYAPYPGGPSGNIIGGTTTGARNVISGNTSYDIYLAAPGTGSNVVEGNYIGTSPDGRRAVGSTFAGVIIFGGATNNTIGGAVTGAGNLISGSYGYGIYISDPGTAGNVVQGNIIGADSTGTNALANGYANILLQLGATNNVIGGTGAGAGNVIAFSPGAGVLLLNDNSTNNAVRGNSIFSNGFLGINFSNITAVANHNGFLAGPNNMQNYPVITNTFGYAGSTIVLGNFNSLPSRGYLIDFYRNAAPDFSGYGEGQIYLGTVSVTTDGSGNATFAYTNTAGNFSGQYVTATATDPVGNTSEFDADLLATNAPAPSAQFAGLFNWRTNGFIFNLTFATNFSYRIQATTNLGTNPVPWFDLTNFTPASTSLLFTDRTATNFPVRFYHVVSP